MITEPIVTYEEAVQRIQTAGLLPLAPLFPDFPSLSSLTPSENWHTDSPLDPWLWRSRLAEEGAAAYGKFVKRKRSSSPVNVSLGFIGCYLTAKHPGAV